MTQIKIPQIPVTINITLVDKNLASPVTKNDTTGIAATQTELNSAATLAKYVSSTFFMNSTLTKVNIKLIQIPIIREQIETAIYIIITCSDRHPAKIINI